LTIDDGDDDGDYNNDDDDGGDNTKWNSSKAVIESNCIDLIDD
jgi:hypothetical protein